MNSSLALSRRWWVLALVAATIVLVAAQVVNRRHAARSRDDSRAVLVGLLDEFQRNRAATAAMQERLGRVVSATTAFLALTHEDSVTLDSITELIASLHLDLPAGPASDVLDSLFEDKGLRVVEDDELNRRLLALSILRQQVQDYLESLGRRHDQELDPALRQTFPLHFAGASEDAAAPELEGDPLLALEDEDVREVLDRSLTAAERAHEGVRRLGAAEDGIIGLIRSELAAR